MMNEATTLKSILLVDDEPDILTVAEIALNQVGGFNVRAYNSSLLAVEDAEEIMPDLIILDMMMPNMDGMQTLKKLRGINSLSQTPIIFMTAKVQKNEVDTYIKAGANGVIEKPFDPMLLSEQVVNIFDDCMTRRNHE